VERIQRLLDGASFDTAGLDYRFAGVWHSCVIARGPAAARAVRDLARVLNRELLSASPNSNLVWAWLGGAHPIAGTEIEHALHSGPTEGASLVLSEPAWSFGGWRVAHRQAQAALRIALGVPPQRCTRWADVAFIEPWLRDPALAQSFTSLMLGALGEMRDGGAMARLTLRAYFDAGCQNEAAALQLGINRSTLARRLSRIERQLGYPPWYRQGELKTALLVEARLAATTSDAPASPVISAPDLPARARSGTTAREHPMESPMRQQPLDRNHTATIATRPPHGGRNLRE
jgi:hypothetical protein